MRRDEIKAIFPEATDEQIKSVMDLNGGEAERNKKLESELKDKKKELETLNSEFESLKAANASGEDWKAKFEALQAENVAKEKQAEADRIMKEKAENINNRFNAALGEKKFSHEAIRESYLKKFGDALDSAENQGKSDTEIIHALTKDDASAFAGVTAVKLAGGRPMGSGKVYSSVAEIMKSDMSREEKRQAIAENIAKGTIE